MGTFLRSKQHFDAASCHTITSSTKTQPMVRYFMSFTVPQEKQRTAQDVIDDYFEALTRNGPGGMRSQCYADHDDDCRFVHIKSFRRESVANHHFRSGVFRNYIKQLAELCGAEPNFSKLEQQQTFESIY